MHCTAPGPQAASGATPALHQPQPQNPHDVLTEKRLRKITGTDADNLRAVVSCCVTAQNVQKLSIKPMTLMLAELPGAAILFCPPDCRPAVSRHPDGPAAGRLDARFLSFSPPLKKFRDFTSSKLRLHDYHAATPNQIHQNLPP
jgi:hypothetical protein